jgi:glycogen synthase
MNVFVVEGPGDALASFDSWLSQSEFHNITSIPFSSLMFDAIAELNFNTLVIATNDRLAKRTYKNITVENVGDPHGEKYGISYHIATLRFAWAIARMAKEMQADVVFMPNIVPPLLVDLLLPRSTKIVLTQHCVLWPEFSELKLTARLIQFFDRLFLKNRCYAVLSVSRAITNQIEFLSDDVAPPVIEFLPSFKPETFEGIGEPAQTTPFRVMFAGRITQDKGIFDILEVARQIQDESKVLVEFEICGSGPAMKLLESKITEYGLSKTFVLRGWCDQQAMRESYTRSHLVVVPTTSQFVEGFNMVVIEAILAGRPVISSAVCPAIKYAPEAVVEVEPDDIEAYKQAILNLASQPESYNKLKKNCEIVQRKFESFKDYSYRRAFKYVLEILNEKSIPTASKIDFPNLL